MGLIKDDPGLLSRPPDAPPLPPVDRDTEPRSINWWWPLLIVALIAGAVTVGVLLAGNNRATTRVEVLPEYEVDTPLVVYEPGFASADFFVGTDANLDPDATWFQEEYLHDTSFVMLGSDLPTFWVGTSGELDPGK